MFREKMTPFLIISFLLLIGISLGFASDPAYWNLSEGANGVTEYAYDSGSFALEGGFEFTTIYVSAKVQNGDDSNVMTAEAYIEVGSWAVHAEAAHKVGTTLQSDDANVSGTGSCDEWYWMVDTRNNDGSGSAWCKWRWIEN